MLEKNIFIVSYLSKQKAFEGSRHTMQAAASGINLFPSWKKTTSLKYVQARMLNYMA